MLAKLICKLFKHRWLFEIGVIDPPSKSICHIPSSEIKLIFCTRCGKIIYDREEILKLTSG